MICGGCENFEQITTSRFQLVYEENHEQKREIVRNKNRKKHRREIERPRTLTKFYSLPLLL